MSDTLKFRGVASATLDTKGRMALPVRQREIVVAVSAGRVVVTVSPYDLCLRLYPLPYWEPVQKEIEGRPDGHRDTRRMQQLMIGHAMDLELDGSGRLLLSAKLREWAGLNKKLCLVGLGEKIEIWDDDRWNDTMQSFRATLEEGKDSSPSEAE